jgi:hypothetical protein
VNERGFRKAGAAFDDEESKGEMVTRLIGRVKCEPIDERVVEKALRQYHLDAVAKYLAKLEAEPAHKQLFVDVGGIQKYLQTLSD